MIRTGIPSFSIVALVFFTLQQPDNRAAFNTLINELRASIEERPEFMVNVMAINEATAAVDAAVRTVLPVDFPVSSFDLDLEVMRREVIALAPVKDATVRIRPGGILDITVTERAPAYVWRTAQGVHLLDAEGIKTADIASRAVRPDLPLVVGLGAEDAIGEAADLLAATGPIAGRVRGLVRVGERRWDLALDRGQTILLPEAGAVQALERVILLSGSKDLLGRDVTHVDLRNLRRPTLRLGAGAVEELRRIKAIELLGDSQ